MTKILLILEKIKNEMLFIKKLRSITNQSFSEIKDSIKNKSPFFAGNLDGPDQEESEAKVKKILNFTKKDGDVIRLFELEEGMNFDINDDTYEITPEMFYNTIQMQKDLEKEYEEN